MPGQPMAIVVNHLASSHLRLRYEVRQALRQLISAKYRGARQGYALSRTTEDWSKKSWNIIQLRQARHTVCHKNKSPDTIEHQLR